MKRTTALLLVMAGISIASWALSLTRGTGTVLSGTLGDVEATYVSDSPSLTGYLDSTGLVNPAPEPIPVVRVQYDLYNPGGNGTIFEFRVEIEPGTVIIGAGDPGGYFDEAGVAGSWGGTSWAELFDVGFGTYDYDGPDGSQWEIVYAADHVLWRQTAAGFLPGSASGFTNFGFHPTFALFFDPLTRLGLQPAEVSGLDGSGSSVAASGMLLSAVAGGGDTDGDGIPDAVELAADLAAFGADPCRETVAVEIDWLEAPDHSHRPDPAAIAEAVAMFDAAPRDAVVAGCPYAGFPTAPTGVQLIVDVDEAIPVTAAEDTAFFRLTDLSLRIRAGGIEAARLPYWHYNVWAHDYSADGNSGSCCLRGLPDGTQLVESFIVALGRFLPGPNGTVREQSGTFVHELGHGLALDHGGDEAVNYKPNYRSVMNYWFQFTGLPTHSGWAGISPDFSRLPEISTLDYSRWELDLLDETDLDETIGLGMGPGTVDTLVRFFGGMGQVVTWTRGSGDGPIDWSYAGVPVIYTPSVAVNINGDVDVSDAPILSNLTGHDDWSNILFQALGAGGYGTPGPEPTVELSWEEYRELLVALATGSVEAPGEACRALIYGQHTAIGAVCWVLDELQAVITISVVPGYSFDRTQIALADNVGDIPANRQGQPNPGHFPINEEHAATSIRSWVIEVPASDDGDLVLAVHVEAQGDDGTAEGAWIEGLRLTDGSWAMYAEVELP